MSDILHKKYIKYNNKCISLKNKMVGGKYEKSKCVNNAYHQNAGE